MKMHSVFLVVALVFPGMLPAQVLPGLQGGFNLCTFSGKNYILNGVDNQVLPGFQTGLFFQIPVRRNISIRPALLAARKGSRGTIDLPMLQADAGTALWYLEMPVVCRVNLIHRKVTLYAEAGGYAAIGLAGKATYSSPDTTIIRTIHWGSDADDEFRRPDFGLTGGVGIAWNRFFAGISGSMGLANIFAFPETGNIIHHRVAGVVAGINIGGVKKKHPSGT